MAARYCFRAMYSLIQVKRGDFLPFSKPFFGFPMRGRNFDTDVFTRWRLILKTDPFDRSEAISAQSWGAKPWTRSSMASLEERYDECGRPRRARPLIVL